MGLWAEHAPAFLLVVAAATTLAFGVPMVFAPLAWGRMMGFRIATETDLAVYYGRCLGSMALVVNALAVRAALTGEAIVFVFEIGLAFSVLMVLVHAWGGIRGIQPRSETIETALWASFVALYVIFFPVGAIHGG